MTDLKAMSAVRRDIEKQVARFTRIDSDINGNPRYYLPQYAIPETHRAYIVDVLGMVKYRGKKYGAGYVIQSYNIQSDALELQRLESLSDYQIQGLQFLRDTSTRMNIFSAVPQRAPQWAKNTPHGVHYSITLENSKGAYTFDFWGSVNDKVNSNTPNEYDVLACLSTETFETFNDFCDNFGYDNDSIKALETYDAVNEQAQQLAKLFTRKQLLALNEIM